MRNKWLGGFLVMMSAVLTASAQTPEEIQSLKNGLSQDQQNSILQGVLGKGNGTGKKTDPKLNTPETVERTTDESVKPKKTRDGRILRQYDEDPELRADDTVVVEMTSLDDMCNGNRNAGQNSTNANSQPNVQAVPLYGAAGNAIGGIGGVIAPNAVNGSGNPNPNTLNITFDFNRCRALPDTSGSNADKEEDKFKKRILSNNPYKLNRFGVLELPGVPAMPIAGLTAAEATKRLGADPDFDKYYVRLTLLRLEPLGHEALKPFGYDLFEGAPSTFAPVSDIQVPMDYIIGPGDTLDIQLYGNEPSSYELTVERDGRVKFPKLGPIMVSGMTFDSAREIIEQRVQKQLLGTRVTVTMGDLRSIRVFVLGEAEKPGSYTVSGLSTMTNALFVSGGVKKIGSLRNIELKRNGRLVTTLDLYDLLLHGDTSGDRQLLPGDVIFIPPIGKTVSIYGAVRRPAIYELKGERTAGQVIELAGGLLPDADARLGQLERILPSQSRQMQNIDLSGSTGLATAVGNGDQLRIPEIRPTLENSVVLSGYVYRPGQFEFHAGLRLSDILNSFDELKPEADLHYILIRRQVPPEQRIAVISADLERALSARGSAADPLLRPRDQIIVFDLSASRERILEPIITSLTLQSTASNPEQVVSIDGQVKAPGRYPLESTMHVSDLIRAGGSLDDSAYEGQAELTRYSVVGGDARRDQLISVDLGAIKRGDPGADLELKPYDSLLIKPTPLWIMPGTFEITGEVRFPGKYPIHQGETLRSLLQRAGGFNDVAFPQGAVFLREELKKREKEQLELLTNRLQGDLAALSLEAVASSAATSNASAGANASAGLLVGQQLLAQLRDAKPVGRLVIDIQSVLNGQPGGPGDVLLRDGDKLLVPKKTQEITVLGEVQSPTSHVYEEGLSRDEYIAKSGGTTQKADRKRIYVVSANGDVVAGNRSGWFRRTRVVEIRPGDTIVVPLDTERIRALPLWQSVSTIIYNLAVALLAVHSVG